MEISDPSIYFHRKIQTSKIILIFNNLRTIHHLENIDLQKKKKNRKRSTNSVSILNFEKIKFNLKTKILTFFDLFQSKNILSLYN